MGTYMSRVLRPVDPVGERVLDQRVHLRVQQVVERVLKEHVQQHAGGAWRSESGNNQSVQEVRWHNYLSL